MKRTLILSLLLSIALGLSARKFDVQRQLHYCHTQVQRTLSQLQQADGTIDYTHAPRNIGADETQWNLRDITTPTEWCAGFFPGILWMDGDFAEAARYTSQLEYLAYQPVYDHDLGFIMIGSYLKGYELTQNEHYRQVLLAAADTLATLYNPAVGTLLSWPRNVKMFGGHNTIMDNMINLELLLWAAQNGGSQRLRDIAIRHAEVTMQNHFRPDHTCYHVAIYDPKTGRHLRNCTHQGLFDESIWSRGQAWAIYGYTMVYRYTREPRFLQFAQQVTDAMLRLLPADGIPYWDMCDPAIPNTYRDASSAAIIASALIDLADYAPATDARRYRAAARKILRSLSSPAYQSGSRNPAFLMHSVGNQPAGSEIDYSINYADYYYIEALKKMEQGH